MCNLTATYALHPQPQTICRLQQHHISLQPPGVSTGGKPSGVKGGKGKGSGADRREVAMVVVAGLFL